MNAQKLAVAKVAVLNDITKLVAHAKVTPDKNGDTHVMIHSVYSKIWAYELAKLQCTTEELKGVFDALVSDGKIVQRPTYGGFFIFLKADYAPVSSKPVRVKADPFAKLKGILA